MKRFVRFFTLILCTLSMFASPMEGNAASSKHQYKSSTQKQQQTRNTQKHQTKNTPKQQNNKTKQTQQNKKSTSQQRKSTSQQKKNTPSKQKVSKPKTQPKAPKQTTQKNQQRPRTTTNNVHQNNYQNSWSKATFDNTQSSVKYHTAKHGNGRSELQYTRDAANFYESNKNLRRPTTLANGQPGYSINKGTQGGKWTNDGKIVTYWD